MTVDRFSIWQLNQSLTRKFLVAATIACIIEFWGGNYRPAYSKSQDMGIEMPVYGQIAYNDLIAQAEALVGDVINRQFSQNTDLSTIQVVVTTNRNGEIIPILMTRVSRNQWQENSKVSDWTEYYSTSYALLQRHDVRQETIVAAASFKPTTNSQELSSQIDRAFDEGLLTGGAAQDYLSHLD